MKIISFFFNGNKNAGLAKKKKSESVGLADPPIIFQA